MCSVRVWPVQSQKILCLVTILKFFFFLAEITEIYFLTFWRLEVPREVSAGLAWVCPLWLADGCLLAMELRDHASFFTLSGSMYIFQLSDFNFSIFISKVGYLLLYHGWKQKLPFSYFSKPTFFFPVNVFSFWSARVQFCCLQSRMLVVWYCCWEQTGSNHSSREVEGSRLAIWGQKLVKIPLYY